MPAKPIKIGNRDFARQGDAISFFKDMLGRYAIGAKVATDDAVDLTNLLLRHVHYGEKVGSGIAYFKVDADLYGWKCFWIVRHDGSEVDFTYRRCITGIW
ncbi:hypothetical protein ACVWWJ_003626 [Luteibacter sp. HA06]